MPRYGRRSAHRHVDILYVGLQSCIHGTLEQARRRAEGRWKTEMHGILPGEKSIAKLKKRQMR